MWFQRCFKKYIVENVDSLFMLFIGQGLSDKNEWKFKIVFVYILCFCLGYFDLFLLEYLKF